MTTSRPPRRLQVEMMGVTMPSWAATALVIVAITASLSLLLGIFVVRDMAREIRLLSLHVEDVENVLIRERIGKREDFPPRQTE